jgi:hypothetical protein
MKTNQYLKDLRFKRQHENDRKRQIRKINKNSQVNFKSTLLLTNIITHYLLNLEKKY